jgi:hypothetical protein
MALQGFIDGIKDGKALGWAFDSTAQHVRQKITVQVDGRRQETIVADQYRADLVRAKKGDGKCAFVYPIPASVKADHVSFVFESNGKPIPRSQGAAGNRQRIEHRLRHHFVFGEPTVDGDFSRADFSVRDIEIAERLIKAYATSHEPRRARRRGPSVSSGGMWSRINNDYHGEAIEILETGDAPRLARYLFNMHKERMVHGVSQGKPASDNLRSSHNARKHMATICWDRLVSLAEALGCLPVESPEQLGHWGENFYGRVEDVVKSIEERLGIGLTAPKVATGLFGLVTSGGVFDLRALDALYAAHRIRELAAPANKSVCEIGAGLGWTAFYAILMGISKYTIIDLPIMNVLQGYCLIKSLPNASVALAGETANNGSPQIHVCTTHDFDRLELSQFSLFFNQDSFPEIGRKNLHKYLIGIRDTRGARLLSINQESEGRSNSSEQQMIVSRETQTIGGFRRVYRFLHWMRPGYVEELFCSAV